ncbi:SpoIIE family protein phosphatase [Streptomyces sp. NBC_01462]|uniref:SpoIIE family protein phosphatase n=1 Tax=Streptomyces sp. NBC_01462 TaxID=2903876 RepID=UPI002E2EF143|nr:SpoIIE family protein phosphatase [Streptomyces sp. NBC_01462]
MGSTALASRPPPRRALPGSRHPLSARLLHRPVSARQVAVLPPLPAHPRHRSPDHTCHGQAALRGTGAGHGRLSPDATGDHPHRVPRSPRRGRAGRRPAHAFRRCSGPRVDDRPRRPAAHHRSPRPHRRTREPLRRPAARLPLPAGPGTGRRCPRLLRHLRRTRTQLPPGRPLEVLGLPPGPLLGIDPAADYPTTEIPLPPEAVLALYTDGLVEIPGTDIGETIADLADQLTAARDQTMDALADTLVHHATHTARRDDDIALLLIQATR